MVAVTKGFLSPVWVIPLIWNFVGRKEVTKPFKYITVSSIYHTEDSLELARSSGQRLFEIERNHCMGHIYKSISHVIFCWQDYSNGCLKHVRVTNVYHKYTSQKKIGIRESLKCLIGDSASLKDALSGLRQFLAPESTLKHHEKCFYLTVKALFVLKIFKFCLDFLFICNNCMTRKVNFKIHDVTTWEINNCNTHIAQYLNFIVWLHLLREILGNVCIAIVC